MSFPTVIRTKAMSAIVVWMLAASLLAGIVGLLATPAAAQNCDRSGGPTAGDWVIGIGDNQVCEDIVIVMDGDLIVQGSLTIRNGGLKFVEDTTHVYSVTVAAGGTLAFENSKLWTETKLINPYMQLTVAVSGLLTLDASTFAFPGTVTTAAGATVLVENGSVIRRTEADVATIFANVDARRNNDDGPGLTFASSTVTFFASRVEDLYENESVGFTGDARQHIRLQGTTTFTAADTFLAIDFCCVTAAVDTHNTLDLEGTSRAFLYGVTTDASENSGTQDQWVRAIDTAAGTDAYVYRWADVSVVDANGVPVSGADVNALFSGPETGPANFTDNGGAATPPAGILAYLGKTGTTWDDTDVAGRARMPLISDWIDTSTMPDSRFIGTFTLDAILGVDIGTATLTFPAYPLMDDASATSPVTIKISTLTQPLPDLTPTPPTFVPAIPKAGQTVQITAPILNQGAGAAANVLVRVSDGPNQLTEQTIPFIAPGTSQSILATLPNASAGQHVIRVFADPEKDIIEGPGVLAEANNLKGYQLSVTALGPDLLVDVSFNPDPGFLNNPVQLVAGVTNVGDRNATNVRVNFYVQVDQPTASSTPVGTATIPFVEVTATASVNWTPTSLGTFVVWAWADPQNAIPEPAPYSEANNLNSNTLTVGPAPDLVSLVQDLTLTDPFPRVNQAVSIEAVVRNNGQALTGGFRVDFTVDGIPVGFRTNATGLSPGQRWVVSPPLAIPPFTTCGQHTIGIDVDSLDQVAEGALYEMNNLVTTTVQVYPNQIFTWFNGAITADQAFSSSLEIGPGSVSISGASIRMVQDQDACGRYYVKVLNGGSLTLTNAELTSNWPLVVFVANGGTLDATGSTFTLDVQGKGVLYSKGTLDVRDSTVVGDVIAKGTRADLRGDTFRGALFYVDTAQTSRVWDAEMPGVTTIQLLSDQTGALAVDFDIRNVTFNAALTGQLVFSGDQYVQLTSVDLTKAGDWWTGMLAQSAHVRRYWWLTVEAVDGTGTPIQDPTTSVDLRRFDPTPPFGWDPVADCSAGECYFNSNNSWMVGIPSGILLYRAAAEDRYGSSPPSVQAAYWSTGWADIEGQIRSPDSPGFVTALVDADTTITLRFSELTPDLRVVTIVFNGENGPGVTSQPIGRKLNVVATVSNAGEIITRDVVVNFYATDVDINRDGYMDSPHSFYNSSGLFIGQAGPLNVSALSSTAFTQPWTPPGTLEGSRTISAVADPSTGPDPRAGGAVAELSETNNLASSTVTIFTWPDLHLASNPVVTIDPLTPIANNTVTLEIKVSNVGTNTATNARIGLFDTNNNSLPGNPSVTFTLPKDSSTNVFLAWMPTNAGLQTIRILVEAAGGVYPLTTFRNWDFHLADDAVPTMIPDNWADVGFDVQTQPELTIALRGTVPSPFKGQTFDLNLTVTNSGQTPASDIAIKVWDQAAPETIIGFLYDVGVPSGSHNKTVRVTTGLSLLGAHVLVAKVDANNSVAEPREDNNEVQVPITVLAPAGTVIPEFPQTGHVFEPGQTPSVTGVVLMADGSGRGVGGVNLTARLVNSGRTTVVENWDITANSGRFLIALSLPGAAALPDGAYTIEINSPTNIAIEPATIPVRIRAAVSIWNTPFLGLPLWVWLIVIIGAAAAIGGGTAYVKFVGLGKLVECGECGAFITEDSTKCPKCGVEFEKDMAKCSNCQAWIPTDVKQCPECGVEFMTGEVEMADYEAQMRKQYDEVKRKFREEASRELGRSLSEREFEDWWRTQPTFVTFEDWLREEEEMRRMGSKPCPVCSTLNSVTATVCHKCGTLLKTEAKKAGRPAPARPAAVQPPTGAPPEGEEAAGVAPPGEAIPKKVVKKPVIGAPIVQKKVIRRPLEEEKKEGEGGEGTGSEEEQI